MKYDDYESLMAHSIPSLAMMSRGEISLKQAIVKFFKITLTFEENYNDLKMIIPEKLKGTHPILIVLEGYDWVYFSEYTDGNIVLLNRKATELSKLSNYP